MYSPVDQLQQVFTMAHTLTAPSRYLYRLDGIVDQEPTPPSIRGNVLEYQGTLRSTRKIVTIKRLRFSSEHTNEVFSVIILAIYVNCFPSALKFSPT